MSEPNFGEPKMGIPRIIKNNEKTTQPETLLLQDTKDSKFKLIEDLKDPLQISKTEGQMHEETKNRVRFEQTPDIIKPQKNKNK